jgi:ankyrin repeat protein
MNNKLITQFDNLKIDEIDQNATYWCSHNAESSGFSLIMKYAILGQYKHIANIINSLLDKQSFYLNKEECQKIVKIMINQQNNEGWSPLILACKNSSYSSNNDTVKLLLENGADVNMTNKDGISALIFASRYSASSSNNDTVKILLKNGANVNYSIDYMAYNFTPLACACVNSSHESSNDTVKILLENGANVNACTNDGKTIVDCTISHILTTSNIDTLKLLLHHKAHINISNNHTYNYFNNALKNYLLQNPN